MTTVTVKNIPEQIYDTLRAMATEHRRSVNSEIVHLIEKATRSVRIEPNEHLTIARKLRNKTSAFAITEQELLAAKQSGRP